MAATMSVIHSPYKTSGVAAIFHDLRIPYPTCRMILLPPPLQSTGKSTVCCRPRRRPVQTHRPHRAMHRGRKPVIRMPQTWHIQYVGKVLSHF